MDNKDDAANNVSPDGTINPALLLIKNNPIYQFGTGIETKIDVSIETLNDRLWLAILKDDLAGVEELIIEGAKPLTPTEFGGYAVDMAVRMNHEAIVCLFYQTPESVAQIGLRTVLAAVFHDRKDIVKIMLDIGMRDLLAGDEIMKIVLYGYACKHGTPEMLDTLNEHGPWFSWSAYWYWCQLMTDEKGNRPNLNKVQELRDEYMKKRKSDKKRRQKGEDIPYLPDPVTEAQFLPQFSLKRAMCYYCRARPYFPILDFCLAEKSTPKHNEVPTVKHDPD